MLLKGTANQRLQATARLRLCSMPDAQGAPCLSRFVRQCREAHESTILLRIAVARSNMVHGHSAADCGGSRTDMCQLPRSFRSLVGFCPFRVVCATCSSTWILSRDVSRMVLHRAFLLRPRDEKWRTFQGGRHSSDSFWPSQGSHLASLFHMAGEHPSCGVGDEGKGRVQGHLLSRSVAERGDCRTWRSTEWRPGAARGEFGSRWRAAIGELIVRPL